MYRNLFYEKLSTIWGNLFVDRNVLSIGVYIILGGIRSIFVYPGFAMLRSIICV